MSIYGFDEAENNSWRVRLEYILEQYNRKQENQALEYNGLRYYLLEDLQFPEIGKMMRKGSICRILTFEKGDSVDYIVDQEIWHFKMEEEGPVKGGTCYYLTNLDMEKPEGKRIQEKLEEEFTEQTENTFVRQYWGLNDIYPLIKGLAESMRCYTSYFTEEELQKTGIQGIPQNSREILCRYLNKSFQGDRFSRMEQAGSVTDEKLTLQKVFVDLKAYPENQNADTEGAMFVREMIRQGNCENRKPDEEQQKRDIRKYLLLGTAGQGKSTVCQYLVQIYRAAFLKRYSQKGLGAEHKSFLKEYEKVVGEPVQCVRIPIHVVIKEYAAWMKKQVEKEESSDIVGYICYQMKRKTSEEFSAQMFRELLKIFSWVFVFDGLDEVPDSSNRSAVIQELQEFQKNELDMVSCDAITICTSRPQGNLEGLNVNNYCRLRLRELTVKQCLEYLERLVEQMSNSESEKERFMEVLRESAKDPVVSYLMKSPLQATIVTILVKTGGRPPRDRYNLFATYYETIKNREKQKDTLVSLHDSMDWIDDLHYQIAYQLQKESESDSNPSAAITKEKFRQLIWSYIEETNGEEDADKLCEPFFHVITERLCFITDVNTEGEYMFTIRSMQEFLAANEMVREPDVIDQLRMIAPFAYWRNVFLFAAGYLQKHMKSSCRDIQDICEELNGKDCTPGEYSLEKIAKAGSWLALDILLEGIYKGTQKTEKIYYDIFFEVKDQASVERLGEFNRLAADKKEVFRERYILPQLQKEPENRVLWHLFCLSSGSQRPLDELQTANLSSREKLELVLYLDEKFKLAEDRRGIDSYILELLEQQDTEIELSYGRCLALLTGERKIQNQNVERLLWKNLILQNARISVPLNGKDETGKIPSFWKRMEAILIASRRSADRIRIADTVRFCISDIERNDDNIAVLKEAAIWMKQKEFFTETSFLHMLICPQKKEIQEYIHTLWQEKEIDREKWLQKHGVQFYITNWLKRQYNTRTLCHMKEEELLKLMDLDFQNGCELLKAAIKERDWNVFWKWNQLGSTVYMGSAKKNIQKYLDECNRTVPEISDMGEEELATLLFVSTSLQSAHEVEKSLQEAVKMAYKEYTKRDWKLCWVNIWARKAALYVMNEQSKTELFSSSDHYDAFVNTEEGKYLYRKDPFFSWEPEQLWKNIIWMLSAVETDHMIFRVIPALALCMPTVSLQFQENSCRQLLSVTCKENLRELGRFLFLMLIPDWTEEECELLVDQIMYYIKESENECVRLFLHFMDRYPIKNTLQRMIYENLYKYLIRNNAWSSVQGRRLLAEVCESAYLKVQERN